jgi:FHA domain
MGMTTMPAKLILSMDGLVLKEITLLKERTTIGRKPHNDIQIDNMAVSGEHAVIVTILNDSFLEDLGSTNGTLVNGQPIKKHFLQTNDVVELGKYKLKYIHEQMAKQTSPQDFEKTMVLRPTKSKGEQAKTQGSQSAEAPPADPQPGPSSVPSSGESAAPSGARLAAIQVLTGSSAGKELDLVKALTTLGKPGVQVAVIAKRPHGYFITHVEGTSFPIVNDNVLDAQAHPLNDHDIVELAGVKMEFFFKP